MISNLYLQIKKQGMNISRNRTYMHGECNSNLLAKYASAYSYWEVKAYADSNICNGSDSFRKNLFY